MSMPDPSTPPKDLAPMATRLTTMLPGDWRALRPVVDRAKCVKCAVCWLFCPVQCITEKPRWFAARMDVCKGCGVCATECPQNAIAMVSEDAF